MRLDNIKLAHNVARLFKTHWLLKRRVKIPTTSAERVLKANGINVVEAKDVLRPALVEEPYSPIIEKNVEIEQPHCYIFTNNFQPIAGVEQCQLLTNSIVFDSLPKVITDKVLPPSKDDEEIIKKCALSAYLLDATQDWLPHVFDVHNHPGYRPNRKFGITNQRKISSLVHKLLLHLNQMLPSSSAPRFFLEDVMSGISLKHLNHLMHFKHEAKVLICSRTPITPVASPDEVKRLLEGTSLPDIFPLSPFVHSDSSTTYGTLAEGFAVPGAKLSPHTIVVSCGNHLFRAEPEQVCGMALLQAFSHSAAYVKEKLKKSEVGDLENPVTVNIAMTTGKNIHLGRFQLNTLDLSPSNPVKNLYWSSAWLPFFKDAVFTEARAEITELDATPYVILKSLFL